MPFHRFNCRFDNYNLEALLFMKGSRVQNAFDRWLL